MSDTVVVADTGNDTLAPSQYAEIMSTLGNLEARVGAIEATLTSDLIDAVEDAQEIVEDIIDDAVTAADEATAAAQAAEDAAAISTIAAIEASEAAEDVEEFSEEIVTDELSPDDILEISEPESVTLASENSDTEDTILPQRTHFMYRKLGGRR